MLNNAFKLKIFVVVICLLPLLPIWYYDYLPLQDYANHFARLSILTSYEQADFYREYFQLVPMRALSPLTYTYLTLDMFVNTLSAFLGIAKAMKVFLTFYVIFYIASIFLISYRLKIRFDLLMIIQIPLIYSCFFHLGLLNFLFSIPLLMFTFFAVESYEMKRNKFYIVLIGIFLMLLYFTHIATFVVFYIFLICYLITKRQKAKILVLILVTISLFMILNSDFFVSMGKSAMMKEPFLDKIIWLMFPFAYQPYKPLIISSILSVLSMYIIIRNSSCSRKHYLIASILFLFIYFILPYKSSVGSIDVRTLLFSLVILPLSFDTRNNRPVDFAKVILLVVIFINFSWLFISFSDFNKNFSTICAGEIEERSVVLPIVTVKPQSPAARPYLNSWGYFYGHKEILTPYLFMGSPMRIVYKHRPPAPYQWWFLSNKIEEVEKSINAIQETYNYILLIGNDAQVQGIIKPISYKVCSDRSVSLYKIEKDKR
jgi:hypothetical protein